MPLPENEAKIVAVVEALSPHIIGQQLPAWSCSCGSVRGSAATAVRIEPAGTEFPGQEAYWYLWTVQMRPNSGEPDHPWHCGISQFVPKEELEPLFAAQQFIGRYDR